MGQRHHQFRKSFRAEPLRRKRNVGDFVEKLIAFCIVVALMFWFLIPKVERVSGTPEEIAKREASVYYSGCNDARAAGAAPIHRGEPGYRPEMDGDNDGIACEPYY